jgi:hypothetical protein
MSHLRKAQNSCRPGNDRGARRWSDICDQAVMNNCKDPTELKRLISQKSDRGQLPRIGSARTWAGNGSGAVCELCECVIEAGQIEYEVEYLNGSQTTLLHFHELCYRLCSEAAWQLYTTE